MIDLRPLPFLRLLACWLTLALVSAPPLFAADAAPRPFVSPIFGDSMVLQRGKPNPIWGWTEPGAMVRVTVDGRTVETTAGSDGRWEASVEPPPVGGPYEIMIAGPQQVVLRDVLVGDVWLCSGQSNMGVALRGARGGADEARTADAPQIRLFAVASRPAYMPVDIVHGTWRVCTSETAGGFSAVAYFFARRLQGELHIPIGLVQAALGGSPAESWISPAGIAATGEFTPQLEEIARLRAEGAPEIGSFLMHWLARHDAGDKDAAWAQPALDEAGWKPVALATAFADLGVAGSPGVVWFRREIELPDPLPAGDARLQLGQVGKMDTTYLNGRWIGASSWVENPRNYAVPEGTLKPGRNVVAVRVFKSKPAGGFLDGPPAVRLQFGPATTGTTIPLGDGWRARLSVDARPPHPLPLDLENYPTMPAVLHQGMIAPLGPLAITGVAWYQGEANFTRAAQYRKLLPALIADWRAQFRDPHMPFYIVSLPAFMARREAPGTSDGWAELRDAQIATARTTAGTAVVVTVDVGDAANIHPVEKRPVGERLAAVALAGHYGRKLPAQGPTFAGLEKNSGALRVRFDHTDGGLVGQGDKLGEFAVAGKDRVWHWAQAAIDGDTVVLSSAAVPDPVAVRYAWQANPLATLFNGAGFPAVPFRTDDWPLTPQ